MEITNGETTVDMPPRLASLLIKNRDWELADESDQAKLDEFVAEQETEVAARLTRGGLPVEEESEGVAERNTEVEEQDEEPPAAQAAAEKEVAAAEAQAPAAVEVNNEATCDDDLPDGVVFADSAYTTVVDKATGEKIRVLKTHCRNDHEYAGANVKIRVRDGKAYRECQTCLKARRARSAAKR